MKIVSLLMDVIFLSAKDLFRSQLYVRMYALPIVRFLSVFTNDEVESLDVVQSPKFYAEK